MFTDIGEAIAVTINEVSAVDSLGRFAEGGCWANEQRCVGSLGYRLGVKLCDATKTNAATTPLGTGDCSCSAGSRKHRVWGLGASAYTA